MILSGSARNIGSALGVCKCHPPCSIDLRVFLLSLVGILLACVAKKIFDLSMYVDLRL